MLYKILLCIMIMSSALYSSVHSLCQGWPIYEQWTRNLCFFALISYQSLIVREDVNFTSGKKSLNSCLLGFSTLKNQKGNLQIKIFY